MYFHYVKEKVLFTFTQTNYEDVFNFYISYCNIAFVKNMGNFQTTKYNNLLPTMIDFVLESKIIYNKIILYINQTQVPLNMKFVEILDTPLVQRDLHVSSFTGLFTAEHVFMSNQQEKAKDTKNLVQKKESVKAVPANEQMSSAIVNILQVALDDEYLVDKNYDIVPVKIWTADMLKNIKSAKIFIDKTFDILEVPAVKFYQINSCMESVLLKISSLKEYIFKKEDQIVKLIEKNKNAESAFNTLNVEYKKNLGIQNAQIEKSNNLLKDKLMYKKNCEILMVAQTEQKKIYEDKIIEVQKDCHNEKIKLKENYESIFNERIEKLKREYEIEVKVQLEEIKAQQEESILNANEKNKKLKFKIKLNKFVHKELYKIINFISKKHNLAYNLPNLKIEKGNFKELEDNFNNLYLTFMSQYDFAITGDLEKMMEETDKELIETSLLENYKKQQMEQMSFNFLEITTEYENFKKINLAQIEEMRTEVKMKIQDEILNEFIQYAKERLFNSNISAINEKLQVNFGYSEPKIVFSIFNR